MAKHLLMGTQALDRITPHSIEIGPINFNLYTPGTRGNMVLFCRAGFEITTRHKQILDELDRSFFITSADRKNYIDYTFERLTEIISNPEIRVSEKASILHGVGVQSVQRLLDDPTEKKHFEHSEQVISNYLDLILSSPDAAGSLFALSATDPYTFSHSINVATLNILMGEVVYPGNRLKLWELGMAGLMHDIGKTRISERILFKKGPLTASEFEEIKKHTVYGEEIVQNQEYEEAIYQVARYHHEWMDGGGYPDGIEGRDVPEYARITAVCDVYDALTSRRVYKDEQSHFQALQDMAKEIGHFDADFFDVLLHIVLRNEELVSHFQRTYVMDRDHIAKSFGISVVDVSELSDIEVL